MAWQRRWGRYRHGDWRVDDPRACAHTRPGIQRERSGRADDADLCTVRRPVGLSRQAVVLAYQTGAGLMELLTPTNGALMAVLLAADVPFSRWVRFAVVGVVAGAGRPGGDVGRVARTQGRMPSSWTHAIAAGYRGAARSDGRTAPLVAHTGHHGSSPGCRRDRPSVRCRRHCVARWPPRAHAFADVRSCRRASAHAPRDSFGCRVECGQAVDCAISDRVSRRPGCADDVWGRDPVPAPWSTVRYWAPWRLLGDGIVRDSLAFIVFFAVARLTMIWRGLPLPRALNPRFLQGVV